MKYNRFVTVLFAILTCIVILAITATCIFCVLRICGFDSACVMQQVYNGTGQVVSENASQLCDSDFVQESHDGTGQVDSENASQLSNSEKVEATILSSGIAIIGIAIAVWSGLNIVNAISKKDLKNSLEQLEPLRNDIKSLQKVAEDLFLQELLKTSPEGIISKYFYNQFSEKADDMPSDLTFSLLNIEQLFYQIYLLHNRDDKSRLSENANTLLYQIAQCKKAVKSNRYHQKEAMQRLLEFYLYDRKAGCYFYQGYVDPRCFIKALDIYDTIFKKFDYEELRHVTADKEIAPLKETNDRKKAQMIYFANTVGECYSKLLHRYHTKNICLTKKQLEDAKVKAIYYCRCATEWETYSYEKPEIYYRNLGCAYERVDRLEGFGKNSDKIFENYKKAWHLLRYNDELFRVQNVYHVLLSYYYRYFKHKYFGNQSFSIPPIKRISAEDFSELIQFLDISEIAKTHLPKHNIPYEMNGFACACIIGFLKNHDPIVSKKIGRLLPKYQKKIRGDLSMLSALGVDDDYKKELEAI